jgi:FAD/FMN-containing dehydrogenase
VTPSGARGDPLARRIAQVVGDAHCLVEPDLCAPYEVDWSGRYRGRARLVARPKDVEQVREVVLACSEAGIPVVPQGGNTGLVGGSVPRGDGGQVVLSLRRLDSVGEVDQASREVVAGAGVTLAELDRAVEGHGLRLGVDLAARDSATLGGMTATNAGGIHFIRYGPMRSQVTGVEAVLADGRVLRRMGGTRKDNVGYDMVGLLAGSEGTLAVITSVRVRLVPIGGPRAVALLALEKEAEEEGDLSASATRRALEIVAELEQRLGCLDAAEIFYPAGLDLLLSLGAVTPPFGSEHDALEHRDSVGAYLLVEHQDGTDPLGELADVLEDAPFVRASAASDDPSGMKRLWELRERLPEAASSLGIPHKLDVAVPLARLPELVDRLPAVVEGAAPGASMVCFGHVGDGNLHVNVIGPRPDEYEVDEAVLSLVASLGGSISAEHGIGVAKAHLIGMCRDAADLAAMKALKHALDPAAILNPGVIFEAAPALPQ